MTLQIKIIIIIGFLVLYGLGVWHIHSWYDGYKETKELQAEIAQHQKDQIEANQHASDLEKELAKERENSIALNSKLEDASAKVTNNCPVPISLIRLRNNAI